MDSHRTHHHGAGTLALLTMASTLALFLLTSCSATQPKEEDTPVRPWEDNGIPTVYLTIDPAEFEQVNASEDHSYRASGATVKPVLRTRRISSMSSGVRVPTRMEGRESETRSSAKRRMRAGARSAMQE